MGARGPRGPKEAAPPVEADPPEDAPTRGGASGPGPTLAASAGDTVQPNSPNRRIAWVGRRGVVAVCHG